jgi:dCMP deaminase
MARLSRQAMFMRIAHVVSERSTCARLNVGAVITQNNRIVSMGWNGQQPGDDHCTGADCPTLTKPGGCGTIHAENNAIRYMPERVLRSELYVTDSPCLGCAQIIERSGYIDEVYFGRIYRDHSGLEYLQHHGIKVFQVMPNGVVLPWSKKS